MTVTICALLSAVPGRESALRQYEDLVLELVGAHNGRLITRLRTLEGSFTEIHVLEFASEQSFTDFQDDPRRLALSELRQSSVASTTVVRVEQV
jgi:uncharacterized protein (DUF1330 family)